MSDRPVSCHVAKIRDHASRGTGHRRFSCRHQSPPFAGTDRCQFVRSPGTLIDRPRPPAGSAGSRPDRRAKGESGSFEVRRSGLGTGSERRGARNSPGPGPWPPHPNRRVSPTITMSTSEASVPRGLRLYLETDRRARQAVLGDRSLERGAIGRSREARRGRRCRSGRGRSRPSGGRVRADEQGPWRSRSRRPPGPQGAGGGPCDQGDHTHHTHRSDGHPDPFSRRPPHHETPSHRQKHRRHAADDERNHPFEMRVGPRPQAVHHSQGPAGVGQPVQGPPGAGVDPLAQHARDRHREKDVDRDCPETEPQPPVGRQERNHHREPSDRSERVRDRGDHMERDEDDGQE